MKKLFLVFMVLALIGLTAGPPAFAANITVYDGKESGNTVNLINGSYFGAGVGREIAETEPGTQLPPTAWDFEGFFLNGTTLTTVARFNLELGANSGQIPLGDLFIKVGGTPLLNTNGTGIGTEVANSDVGTYNYAVIMRSQSVGNVYSLVGDDKFLTATPSGQAIDDSNPWRLKDTSRTAIGSVNWTYGNFTGSLVAGQAANTKHYTASVDLSSFLGPNITNHHFKLTYQCGNDDLHGAAVPIPGAVLLLGAGIARLVAYARRRQE